MIRVDEIPCLPECVFVPKAELELAALESFGHEHGVMRHAPQSQNHTYLRELLQLDLQVRVALPDLLWQWLVLGRYALHGVRDSDVFKPQTVVGGDGLVLGRQSELVKCRVEQFAREVAR